MNILFLDIDGVLNCKTTSERHDGFIGIDPVLLERLHDICIQTDVKIVLSSTWRLLDKDYLKNVIGIDFIDVTPDLRGVARGYEINSWLSTHHDVNAFAILDDDTDMLPGQTLFKTSFETGLTEEIKNKVIAYFIKHAEPKRCLNCGRKMKIVKDPITGKDSIYLWKCKCMPKDVYLSIG